MKYEPTPEKVAIGEKLMQARVAIGYTREEITARTQIPLNRLIALERGCVLIAIHHWECVLLAKLLKINADELWNLREKLEGAESEKI